MEGENGTYEVLRVAPKGRKDAKVISFHVSKQFKHETSASNI